VPVAGITDFGPAVVRRTMPQPAMLGIHPVIHVAYLITRITTHLPTPKGWMAEFAIWLTDSGRLTHKVIIRPASSLAQDRESSPVKDQRSTTVLRRHNWY